MSASRKMIHFLCLLSCSSIALASDSGLILVPALNLIAVALVLIVAISLKRRWDIAVIATIFAALTCVFIWFIPDGPLPVYDWLNKCLLCVALLLPLLSGLWVVWLSRPGSSDGPAWD